MNAKHIITALSACILYGCASFDGQVLDPATGKPVERWRASQVWTSTKTQTVESTRPDGTVTKYSISGSDQTKVLIKGIETAVKSAVKSATSSGS